MGKLLRYKKDAFPIMNEHSHYDEIFERMEELEAKGEILIHRITEENQPVEVLTRTGRIKLIPTNKL